MAISNRTVARVFGEFAIIVLGVLVALGFESWREDVSDRALELEYLQRLQNDFHEDALRIAGAIEATTIQQQHIDAALEILENPEANSDRDLLSVFMASRSVYSREIGSTFQELFGSGRLSLVRNSELRIRLVDFYSWLSIAIAAAPGLEDRKPYRDIVRGEIHPRFQEAIRDCGGSQSRILELPDTNMVLDCDFGGDASEVEPILHNIRANPDALRSLRRWAAAFTALVARLSEVETRISDMEAMIAEELKRH